MFVLDTDFCIDWLRRKAYARASLCLVAPSTVSVSAVTVGELMMGAFCAEAPVREAEKVQAFLHPLRIVPYGPSEAIQFARFASALRQEGTLIGVADTMIAATAETHRATVVTRNLKPYGKVKNLKVVDWEREPPAP